LWDYNCVCHGILKLFFRPVEHCKKNENRKWKLENSQTQERFASRLPQGFGEQAEGGPYKEPAQAKGYATYQGTLGITPKRIRAAAANARITAQVSREIFGRPCVAASALGFGICGSSSVLD
jgi:hypothetical protein